jgi:hypothetical protein
MLCILTHDLYMGGFRDSYKIPKGTVMRVEISNNYSANLVSVLNKYHRLHLSYEEFTSYVYRIWEGV